MEFRVICSIGCVEENGGRVIILSEVDYRNSRK